MAKKILTIAMIVSSLCQFFGCSPKIIRTKSADKLSGEELIGEEVLSVLEYLSGNPMLSEPAKRNIHIAKEGSRLLVINYVPQEKRYYLPMEEFNELEKFLLKFGNFKKEESPPLFDAPLYSFEFTYLKNGERENYSYRSSNDILSNVEDSKLFDMAVDLLDQLVSKAEESGEEVRMKEDELF